MGQQVDAETLIAVVEQQRDQLAAENARLRALLRNAQDDQGQEPE